MINKKNLLITIVVINVSLFADNITVINHTSYPVWVGVYRLKSNLLGNSIGAASLQNNIVKIPGGKKINIKRSDFKIKTNRELFFSDVDGYLKNKFDSNEYKLVSKTPVSLKHGSTFHIAEKDNVLKGYSSIEWKVVEPIISAARQVFDRMLEEKRRKYLSYPHGNEEAIVRRGSNLADQEISFLTKRVSKVKQALENVLNISLSENEVPRIAVCMSGGGMRAATCAEGLFEGLSSVGLLEALTYAAALSGSTWTLSSFVELGFTMEQYAQHFVSALSNPHVFSPDDLAHVLWPKYIFNEHISIVDLYGVFLAQTFFHNIETEFGRQDIRLSESQRRLNLGECFFPIYTAVQIQRNDLHWTDFTPYEFGIDDFDMHIPIWSFGRKFNEGKSSNFAPEQSLGFLMGIWGSALSGAVRDILGTQKSAMPKVLFKTLNNVFVETGVAGTRFAAIKIFNPLYGVDGASTKNIGSLTMMDAGYDYNLPFPPLLKKEREIDIIIVMDASANVYKNAPEFQKAVKYIESKNIPFPVINFESIMDESVTIFEDKKNESAPTIIFLAPIKNENYDAKFDPKNEMTITYATAKFVCGSKDVKKLSGLINKNITDNKEKIYRAIKNRIELKRKKRIVNLDK